MKNRFLEFYNYKYNGKEYPDGMAIIPAIKNNFSGTSKPDISQEATTIIKEGVNVKTIIAERAIKKAQEE